MTTVVTFLTDNVLLFKILPHRVCKCFRCNP